MPAGKVVVTGKSYADWRRFLCDVEKARHELDCVKLKQDVWFRGLASSTYDLTPSLFRQFESPNEGTGGWPQVRQLESDLFYEFVARAGKRMARA